MKSDYNRLSGNNDKQKLYHSTIRRNNFISNTTWTIFFIITSKFIGFGFFAREKTLFLLGFSSIVKRVIRFCVAQNKCTPYMKHSYFPRQE